MKNGVVILSILFSSLSLAAQKTEWKEMHAFHLVMSATFHSAEENKLQPLKDSAASLADKATKWELSVVPSGYNASITRPILKKLAGQCRRIQKSVKNGESDEALKKQISDAHDTFHEIMEKCRKE